MLSPPPGNTRHVSWLPCKDVPVLTEELDERFFLLRVDSKAKPVKEHLRRSAVQKKKAIGEEVARLLAA